MPNTARIRPLAQAASRAPLAPGWAARRRLLRSIVTALPAPWLPTVAGAAPPLPPFAPVSAGQALGFPRDHGAHPSFRTEWWYLTAWIDTPGGDAGLQVTFFRSRTGVGEQNPSRFAPTQLLFAHAALSLPERGHVDHEQIARRADGPHARFSLTDTDILIGPPRQRWQLSRDDDDRYRIAVETPRMSMQLRTEAGAPAPWLQGSQGFSRKGPAPEQASYYYSRPRLSLTGQCTLGERRIPVRAGLAWLDHEWSSTLLADSATGWDWVGLNFLDGRSLMAFRIRDRAGTDLWNTANWRAADGGSQGDEVRFEPLRSWRSPATGIDYPVEMRLTLADGASLRLRPLFDDQEIDARASTGTLYWEGAVTVLDERRELAEIGRGYLELTGYAGAVRL